MADIKPEDIRSTDYDSPAFPTHPYIRHDENGFVAENNLGMPGMTLRDYFAAPVTAALIEKIGEGQSWCAEELRWIDPEDMAARRAYKIADAMLNRRRL
jgi:hypothetical protein